MKKKHDAPSLKDYEEVSLIHCKRHLTCMTSMYRIKCHCNLYHHYVGATDWCSEWRSYDTQVES